MRDETHFCRDSNVFLSGNKIGIIIYNIIVNNIITGRILNKRLLVLEMLSRELNLKTARVLGKYLNVHVILL